jgi:hypothetical protein
MVVLVSGLISLSKIKLMPVARDNASNTTLIFASRSSSVMGVSNTGLSFGGLLFGEFQFFHLFDRLKP